MNSLGITKLHNKQTYPFVYESLQLVSYFEHYRSKILGKGCESCY